MSLLYVYRGGRGAVQSYEWFGGSSTVTNCVRYHHPTQAVGLMFPGGLLWIVTLERERAADPVLVVQCRITNSYIEHLSIMKTSHCYAADPSGMTHRHVLGYKNTQTSIMLAHARLPVDVVC